MGPSEFYEYYANAGFAQLNSEKVKARALCLLKSPVLDAGCYFGEKTGWLSSQFEVDGCDISRTAIKKAKQTYPKLRFFECDLEKENLAFAKKYNSVFAAELIEHLFQTQTFLDNCYSGLNKGGLLFLTTPNVTSLLNRLRLLFGDDIPISGDKAHIRFFKPQTLKAELERAGFEKIRLEGYNTKPFLKKIPLPLNLCDGIIAVAKK